MTINTTTISGNLARDPEIRTSANGSEWATFTVTVNERKKNGEVWEDVPSFIDCKAFGWLASNIVAKLSKGSRAVVHGRLVQERWQDKDGGNRSALRVVADEVVIMAGTAPIAGAGAKPEAYYEEPLADEPLPF